MSVRRTNSNVTLYVSNRSIFEIIMLATNCDIVLSSNITKSGIIMSPMFPRAYEPNTHCRFEFRGNARERIQLSFKEFTLPSEADGDDCEQSDTLQVVHL